MVALLLRVELRKGARRAFRVKQILSIFSIEMAGGYERLEKRSGIAIFCGASTIHIAVLRWMICTESVNCSQ